MLDMEARKMKTITVTFDDGDFEALEKVKGNLTWRELILSTLRTEGDENGRN